MVIPQNTRSENIITKVVISYANNNKNIITTTITKTIRRRLELERQRMNLCEGIIRRSLVETVGGE